MIFEPDHDVAVQLKSPWQFQVDYPLLLEVELHLIWIILICVYLGLVQAINLVNFIKWFITAIAETTRKRHISDGYSFEILDLGR